MQSLSAIADGQARLALQQVYHVYLKVASSLSS